jgi:hypothetical protein
MPLRASHSPRAGVGPAAVADDPLDTAAARPAVAAEAPPASREPGDDTAAADQQERRRATAVGVLGALAMFFGSRAFAAVAIVIGNRVIPGMKLHDAFNVWDSAWYTRAMEFGYPQHIAEQGGKAVQSTIAFFPAFPLLGRLVHVVVGGSYLRAGIVAALVSGATATVLLWLLARHLADERMANRAVALFCFFPASFALLLPFSEGLMLSFAIGSMLALLKRHYVLAGALAALATATRPNAIVLGGAFAWVAFHAIRERREYRALIPMFLAPLGIVAYFLFLKMHTDELTAWFRVEKEGWGYADNDWGLTTFKNLRLLWDHPLNDLNALLSSLSVVFAVATIIMLIRWRPAAAHAGAVLLIYAAGIAFLAFFTASSPASRPRYMVSAFPMILGLAWWARTDLRFALTLAGSACLMGVYAIITTATTWAVF